MKKFTFLLSLWLVAGQIFSQIRPDPDPLMFRPATQSKNLKSTANPYNGKSFYQSKSEWKTIIDTTWGQGLPLNEKLAIFDAYTQAVTEKFGGFNSLGIDPTEWDSIKATYHSRIDSTTSRGAFAALMGRLAYDLRDYHAFATDTTLLYTPLNPGTPILDIGDHIVSHFGAVLTALSDSSLLVLRTLDNHPLDLQPGDIVLGYEGVPWKDLVDELLASEIPLLSLQRGAKSATRYNELVSAGMNWHLFETIDVLKYSSGDTLHLSVYPLLNLPVPIGEFWLGGKNLMWNNEQLPLSGVPFPDPNKIAEQTVTYGIIDGTNVGYIYLLIENDKTDGQFYEAVKSLSGTEGLIIDLRMNFGGWPVPKSAINLLFNASQYTLDVASRSNVDFSLYSLGNKNDYLITGNPKSWYDRPIAVLTGPNCICMGDLIAYMLGLHPMKEFFGKSTCASVSDFTYEGSFPEWWLSISYLDFFNVKNPEIFLNRREFPVDDPVWFDAESAANGEDAVVHKAIEWIKNLAYAHKAKVDPGYVLPGTGEVSLTAKVENPNGHELSVLAYITSMDSTVRETVSLFDDGNHIDGDVGDGIWGALWPVPDMKTIFSADLKTEDLTAETTRAITSAVRFTNIGPVVVDGITYTGSDTIPNPGDNLPFKVTLRNDDLTGSVVKVRAKLISLDTLLAEITDFDMPFADMTPGKTSTAFTTYKIAISADCPVNTSIPIQVDVSSDYYIFWRDTLSILVRGPSNIADLSNMMIHLYPNPVQNVLHIGLSGTTGVLEIHDISGKMVQQNQLIEISNSIDVSRLEKGIYFVRVLSYCQIFTGKIVKY